MAEYNKNLEDPGPPLAMPLKKTWSLKISLSSEVCYFIIQCMPIMPTLCSKLEHYTGIMLDALPCLLCLKLCRYNRPMPIHQQYCLCGRVTKNLSHGMYHCLIACILSCTKLKRTCSFQNIKFHYRQYSITYNPSSYLVNTHGVNTRTFIKSNQVASHQSNNTSQIHVGDTETQVHT